MDDDLEDMDRDALIAEVKKLRAGIRAHRDNSGHDLCWHHPQLWGLLPEPIDPNVAVPPWPKFMRGCVAYREALARELADAPVHDKEFDEE
ncbi:hypothetical protein [Euryhalocaulis caribicus]|uniref:hypothetical protein n=1 Tax=Euryhalocaulis caribicus TaxID=1161401 RepID=UPI0003A0B89A|nr:hypothetical protein [Euryhalocaulis caribicus]